MADAYTDACHAMRRWKTTIKTLVSGFSLPVASFSYPARKKSLILRLDHPLIPGTVSPGLVLYMTILSVKSIFYSMPVHNKCSRVIA